MSKPTSSNQSSAQESTPRYPYRRSPRTSNATRIDRTGFLFLFAFIAITLLGNDLDAQQLMKNLGTRGEEISMEMAPVSDGNYVTVGPVTRPPNSPGGSGYDIYLNKIDALGNLIWSRQIRSFDTQGNRNNFPMSVTETLDAAGSSTGFAITGAVYPTYSNSQHPVFIATTDTDGFPSGFSTYGGFDFLANAGVTRGIGVKIIQTPQGELAVCGSVFLDNFVAQIPFILVVDSYLGLRFMRLYHDSRYLTPVSAQIAGHFADIESVGLTNSNGVVIPEGFVVVGTTSKIGDPYTEINVMRTDLNGVPLMVGLYGPQQVPSRGLALTVTTSGDLEVAGLVATPIGIQSETIVLSIDTLTGIQLDLDHYHGFVTVGDIRELSNGDFILNGRNPFAQDAALMRIKSNGNVVFGLGYGGPNAEIYTDVHELPSGDLFASGATCTWCRGPFDEYLVRTLASGLISGCDEYNLNIDPSSPGYPMRETEMIVLDVPEEVMEVFDFFNPQTFVDLICPTPLITPPIPWDWFVRADFNRDLVVNVADVVGILDRLFGNGPASVPEEASDANGDGNTDLADAIFTLTYLFSGGTPPGAPFGEPGPDPSNTQGNILTIEELQQYLQGNLTGTVGIQTIDLGF